jgi:hypothetical protein
MSIDNELWRRFCERRWDVLPKEKDYAKNWLIPMREGGNSAKKNLTSGSQLTCFLGGDKERRVDWKKVYLIRFVLYFNLRIISYSFFNRDLGEKAEEVTLTLPTNNNLFLHQIQESRKKKKDSEYKSVFSQGWLSVKDLGSIDKRLSESLEKMETDILSGFRRDDVSEKQMIIACFHMELELHIMSQVNISRLKYLNFGGSFLRQYREVLAAKCEDKLPRR